MIPKQHSVHTDTMLIIGPVTIVRLRIEALSDSWKSVTDRGTRSFWLSREISRLPDVSLLRIGSSIAGAVAALLAIDLLSPGALRQLLPDLRGWSFIGGSTRRQVQACGVGKLTW